jgi:Uma2 family endonuclease
MIAPNISTDNQTLPLLLNVSNTVLHVSASEFDSLCLDNPDLRLELSKDQELIVMSPTGGESGKRNIDLTIQVGSWSKQTKLGQAFESSTGYDFTAIDGGKMSPDVSWIEKSRLDGIDITGFIPVVPDFVIELRSQSDRLGVLQSKMLEQVEIYRLHQETEILDSPTAIDCQPLMPDFSLDLTEILNSVTNDQ